MLYDVDPVKAGDIDLRNVVAAITTDHPQPVQILIQGETADVCEIISTRGVAARFQRYTRHVMQRFIKICDAAKIRLAAIVGYVLACTLYEIIRLVFSLLRTAYDATQAKLSLRRVA